MYDCMSVCAFMCMQVFVYMCLCTCVCLSAGVCVSTSQHSFREVDFRLSVSNHVAACVVHGQR